jgi:hypothetical protein
MAKSQLCLESIEDYLGDAATRFFATGYRRVSHRIVDVRIRRPNDEQPGAEATVTVEYPRDWSKKTAEMDITPHLSSVDMMVIGAQLCEAHLSHAYGLDARARRQMRLVKVTLKAGVAPQEDLVGLTATANLRKTTALSETENRFVSVYRCKIGLMQAGFEIEHDIHDRAATDASYARIDDILGPATTRYYGEGFTYGRHVIKDVGVDMDRLRADASVQFGLASAAQCPSDGIDGARQPSVSVVDCFVVSLQMVQVLMYEMDAITRQESDTLWMLSTRLNAPDAQQPYPGPLAARAAITAKHLLPLNGRTWRNVAVEGECGGVKLTCSFAHRLPENSASDAAVRIADRSLQEASS